MCTTLMNRFRVAYTIYKHNIKCLYSYMNIANAFRPELLDPLPRPPFGYRTTKTETLEQRVFFNLPGKCQSGSNK